MRIKTGIGISLVFTAMISMANIHIYRSVDGSGRVVFSDKKPKGSHQIKRIELQTSSESVQMQQASHQLIQEAKQVNAEIAKAQKEGFANNDLKEQSQVELLTAILENSKQKYQEAKQQYHEAQRAYSVALANYTKIPSINQQDDALRKERLALMKRVLSLAQARMLAQQKQIQLAHEQLQMKQRQG